jgi:hypothetical protein
MTSFQAFQINEAQPDVWAAALALVQYKMNAR